MSTYMNNLFNFSRPLPVPFDGLTSKKVAVSSRYSEGTQATLCASVVKAILSVCRCRNGTGDGAVGIIDHRSVAEYKSSVGTGLYHLVVYDRISGTVLASIYNKDTELLETYTANGKGQDGAAIMMALMPVLMEDTEFQENFEKFYDQFIKGFPDLLNATEYLGYLCDNAYRRIKDPSCTAHITVNIDRSGNLMRISQTHLDSGTFTPVSVMAGEFTIFTSKIDEIKRADCEVTLEEFVGKYELHHRKWSVEEEKLIPKLPAWYIIPREVVDVCRHAQATTGKTVQMRNFLLRGPAGTGKTMGAKAIAAGLHLPYMKYTCSASTEIYDFIGMLFPDVEKKSNEVQLEKERKEILRAGGITYTNLAKMMGLPDLDDLRYDPKSSYQTLTGIEKEDATMQECIEILLNKVTEKIQILSKKEKTSNRGNQNYIYVESDFIKALRNGYVIEIQEPTMITQPGVLVGLNSLLEQEGTITLPTGEIIQRHPDTVVVVTTNISYEGCRNMNQSVVDRMNLVQDIGLPSTEIVIQRAMSVTGCTDEYQVSQMVQVVKDMEEYCRRNSITDGTCGMRSLIDWIISTEISGDPYTSAMYTIISKATADEEDREALRTTVLEPIFAPRSYRKAL